MMTPRRFILSFLGLALASPADARQEQPLVATRLAAGAYHTCAIAVDGRTFCWGDNRHGQSAAGMPTRVDAARMVPGPQLVEIAAGGRHTCGLDRQGLAWCWGDNAFGQLGNGARTRRDEPTAVKGGLRFVAITAGESHTCALAADGQAWCWGDQWDRAAGAFRAGDNLTEPFPVKRGRTFDQLAAGGHHTCGVTREHEIWCWGNNAHGQVAPATSWDVIDYPALVPDLPPARAVRTGASFSCALAVSGSVRCWGSLGTDSTSIPTVPGPAAALDQITAGSRHICARTNDGETFCWGDNRSHQIGPIPAEWTARAVAVPALRDFSLLSAGADHTCGLDGQGRVYCWGANAHGQLGRPGPGSPTPQPVPLPPTSSHDTIRGLSSTSDRSGT